MKERGNEQAYSYLEKNNEELIFDREGNLLFAVFSQRWHIPYQIQEEYKRKGFPIPKEFLAHRQEVVTNEVHSLPQPHRFIIEKRFGFTDGQPKTLKEIGEEYGNMTRGYPYSTGWVRPREQGGLRRLDENKLMLFLPLTDHSVGKTVWDMRYPCELEKRYPNIPFPEVVMSNLELSPATYQELVDREIITKYLIPKSIIFSKFPFPQDIRFITFLPQAIKDLSDASRLDLRKSLEMLQERLQQAPSQ